MSMATRTPAGQVLTRLGFALAVVIHLLVLYVPSVPSTVDVAVPGADKAAHVLVFAAVMATGVIARLPAPWLAAVLAAHAGVSEVIQEFLLAGRTGDVWDAVADLGGVALGWYLASVVRRRRLEIQAEPHPGPDARTDEATDEPTRKRT